MSDDELIMADPTRRLVDIDDEWTSPRLISYSERQNVHTQVLRFLHLGTPDNKKYEVCNWKVIPPNLAVTIL